MHTAIVLGGGFAALICCLLLGHAWSSGMPGLLMGAKVFIPLWLLGAFVNMYVGTTHGYTWGEEFPIFLAIFAIPAAAAALIWWKFG